MIFKINLSYFREKKQLDAKEYGNFGSRFLVHNFCHRCLFWRTMSVLYYNCLLKWYSILLFVKQTKDAMAMESGKWYANWTTRIGRRKSSIHWYWRKWWRHQNRWRTLCPKSQHKWLRFHWHWLNFPFSLFEYVQIISRKRRKGGTMWISHFLVKLLNFHTTNSQMIDCIFSPYRLNRFQSWRWLFIQTHQWNYNKQPQGNSIRSIISRLICRFCL